MSKLFSPFFKNQCFIIKWHGTSILSPLSFQVQCWRKDYTRVARSKNWKKPNFAISSSKKSKSLKTKKGQLAKPFYFWQIASLKAKWQPWITHVIYACDKLPHCSAFQRSTNVSSSICNKENARINGACILPLDQWFSTEGSRPGNGSWQILNGS